MVTTIANTGNWTTAASVLGAARSVALPYPGIWHGILLCRNDRDVIVATIMLMKGLAMCSLALPYLRHEASQGSAIQILILLFNRW